jgi:hypothetical protein
MAGSSPAMTTVRRHFFLTTFGFGSGFSACGSKPI